MHYSLVFVRYRVSTTGAFYREVTEVCLAIEADAVLHNCFVVALPHPLEFHYIDQAVFGPDSEESEGFKKCVGICDPVASSVMQVPL